MLRSYICFSSKILVEFNEGFSGSRFVSSPVGQTLENSEKPIYLFGYSCDRIQFQNGAPEF